MSEIPPLLFFNFFIYLLIPFFLAILAKRVRISPIIGYILGGVIISNFFGGLISKDIINHFAYFGIIFLLFTVGLEIQFDRIISLKKFILIGGSLQMIITVVFLTGLSLFFKFSFMQGVLIGIALSSSSTTLVAKIIQDGGEENSFHGELALGILMFQDLAFIPFMILFVSITSKTISFLDLSWKVIIGILTSAIILWAVYYFGKKIIPYVFDKIARISRELLNLFIILFIFFIAYVSTFFGIPILVSIFVAGILVSQTLEHYHIFSQIRPLRDLLAIIFFIYIGSSINIGLIFPFLPQILVFAFFVILIKALIILLIFIFLKFNSKLSLFLSLFLFQVDEDAFILMSLAYTNGIFSQDQYLFIVTVILLSLIMTPVLINNKEKIYLGLKQNISKFLPIVGQYIKHRIDFSQSPIDILGIKDHVIICGYGRIGSYIGRALMLANIPFVAIDFNFHTVEKAKKEGINIIYGDPTDIDILDYAEGENAVAVVLALPDRFSQEAIVLNAKKLKQDIVIISRVHRKKDHKRMKDLGVRIVIQPEFEASLSIIKKLFLLKRMAKDDIVNKLHYFKLEQEGV